MLDKTAVHILKDVRKRGVDQLFIYVVGGVLLCLEVLSEI